MATAQAALWVVILLVALALAFDFMNGFHDAANSIATVVSTGVLKPGQAVVFAAFFNLVAIFVFHLSVAATIGKGIVQPGVVDTHVVFGALVGAIAWNVRHLVLRHPQQFVARADRRHRRRRDGQGRRGLADRGRHLEDRAVHLRVAAAGLPARLVHDDAGGLGLFRRVDAVARGPLVPPPAAGLGRRLQPGPRRQRRAEDHRHHLDAADRHRLRGRRRDAAADLGDRRAAIPRSRWAPCSAAGASSRPWARRSPSSSPWAASAPRPAAR